MSLQSIFNKLTLDEIKELSDAMIKNQADFFGNNLKQSKQYVFISQLFGIKNWNTLSGLKKVKDVYPCPNCGSLSLRIHSDSVTEYTLDENGNILNLHRL